MPIRRLLRGRGSRRSSRKEWTAFTVVNNVVGVNGQSVYVLASDVTFEEWPKATILRIRGTVVVSPNTQPAAATGYVVALGVALLGNSESWDAELNQQFPWMWYQMIFPQTGGNGAADNNSNQFASYFHIPIDVRAMRKISEEKSLVLVAKNSSLSGAAVKVSAQTRILLLVGH